MFISGKPRGLPFGGRLGVFHVTLDERTRSLLRTRAAMLDTGEASFHREVHDLGDVDVLANAGVAGALDSFARDMASMWPFDEFDPDAYEVLRGAATTGYLAGAELLGRSAYDLGSEGGADRIRQALLARTHCYATSDVDLLVGGVDHVDAWLDWVRGAFEFDAPALAKLGDHAGAAVAAETAMTGLLIAVAENEIFTSEPAEAVAGANEALGVPAHHHRFDYAADPMEVTHESEGLVPFSRCVFPLCSYTQQWPRPPEHEHRYDLGQDAFMMLDGHTVYRCTEPGCPVLRLYGGSDPIYM